MRNDPPRSQTSNGFRNQTSGPRSQASGQECYNCGGIGHIVKNCPSSSGREEPGPKSYVPGAEGPEDELFQHGVASGINFSRYENIDVKISGGEVVDKIDSFEDACLHPTVLDNIRRSNYTMPTPVQKHALPNIMAGRDMMACAQTGSGKTAAFLLPVINLLLESKVAAERVSTAQAPQAIIISPTRELAIQIKVKAILTFHLAKQSFYFP